MSESALDMLCRLALRTLAPAGPRARLAVLIFHRVLRERDPLQPGEPTAQEFERQLRWVKGWFNVIPLSEAVAGLRSERLPERPLAITFDDGYADNHDVALPVLQRLGLPATFFVATSFLDGGRMFNDTVIESIRRAKGDELDLTDLGLGKHDMATIDARRRAISAVLEGVKYLPPREREACVEAIAARVGAALPNDLMMRSAQVARLRSAGMEIGAHTHTHPILQEISVSEARDEMQRGRQRLEEIVGGPVRLFAYPNGRPGRDYGAVHVSLVRELGFEAACSTAWGAARTGSDLFQIPRFTPWDQRAWRFALRMARTMGTGSHMVAQ